MPLNVNSDNKFAGYFRIFSYFPTREHKSLKYCRFLYGIADFKSQRGGGRIFLFNIVHLDGQLVQETTKTRSYSIFTLNSNIKLTLFLSDFQAKISWSTDSLRQTCCHCHLATLAALWELIATNFHTCSYIYNCY